MINEKLLDTYSSSDIVRLIHSFRRGWVDCVAHNGEMRNVYRVFGGEI